MKSLESNTVTFVVTIWVDASETTSINGSVIWRGEIRDVMGVQQTRTSFTSLQEIAEFIRPYLERRGV